MTCRRSIKNDGTGYLADVSLQAGLGVVTQYVQWGVGLVDFDNDTWPDLFYVTGHVYPEIERVNPDYPYKGPRLLFRNLGNGKFVNATNRLRQWADYRTLQPGVCLRRFRQ